MEYLRGSEWRRWDFHLHTPFTKKNDLYSGNGDEKWTQFYADVISYIGDGSDPQRKIAAVGITDYFSIENYKKIKADGILDKYIDFIFPNIELRCLPLKDGVMMNVHLLINPTFVDKVDTVVLSNLKYKFSTGEYCARKEDLIRYGKDLDPTLDDYHAYIKGVDNFHINFDDITSLFSNHPECQENILVLLPNRSTDGASAVANPNSPSQDLVDLFEYRKDLYRVTNLILSATPSDIAYFSGLKGTKPERLIPCVWGCDAHKNTAIFEPLDNDQKSTKRYCWIKADPSWEGLKQTLFEPTERVKIQEFCPADRIDTYRIIDRIIIEDDNIPHRFSNEAIKINENLTCIIGLKSTGKSVLLQNIAHAIDPVEVDSRLEAIYQNKKRAWIFPVKVYWKDGTVSYNDSDDDKKIVYIPQSYLNKLMDANSEKTEIDTIIENIICQNKDFCQLQKLFDTKLIEIKKQIEAQILELVYKRKELDVQNAAIKELGKKDSIVNNIKALKEKKETLVKALHISQEDIEKYNAAVNNKHCIEQEIERLLFDKQSIDLDDPIVVKTSFEVILDTQIKKSIDSIISEITNQSNMIWREKKSILLQQINQRVTTLKNNLHECTVIIESLQPMIDDNAEVKKIEANLRLEELNLEKICKENEKLLNIEKEMNSIIATILSLTTARESEYDEFAEHFKTITFKDTNENFKIIAIKRRRRTIFNDTISKVFTQSALKSIHNGAFRNITDDNFILEAEFDEACKESFIKAILSNDTQKVLLSKYDKEHALQELLSDFDNIIYTVEMDGDLIENMSPGKKALVLLKLLISHDESKCPILLDQPEDDLDNLSIVSELVSFIRTRKQDRQIILVTHNANLVLGCDAEEVIVANQQIAGNSLTKNESFRFEYRSGSIENITITNPETFLGTKGIQNHICNILEGGKEAFIARKNKYTNL